MTVGEKIQEYMDWYGVSQEKLSQMTKIPRSTIGGYVSNNREVSVSAARTIAKALGISLWVLLNGEPMPVHPLDINEEEEELLLNYRSLPLKSQQLMAYMMREMREIGGPTKNDKNKPE